MRLVRSKTWTQLNREVDTSQDIINSLLDTLSLIPLKSMERGDLWNPGQDTILTFKRVIEKYRKKEQ